jgi:hypothetical protein
MSETQPVTFTEERVPVEGIEETVAELIELYGGTLEGSTVRDRRFILPLRRGIAAGGGVECTLSWTDPEGEGGAVTMTCGREVDAPRAQRVLLLVAGAAGALLFTLWPFFQRSREFGALAWIGGAIALAVYFLTLRKTSGGLAYDFLRRLAARQRDRTAGGSA